MYREVHVIVNWCGDWYAALRPYSWTPALATTQELLNYSNHASNGVHTSTVVVIDRLHQVQIDALQLLQPQQELQSASNHMSTETDVMIDELPQVHNNALQLQQPQELLTTPIMYQMMFT